MITAIVVEDDPIHQRNLLAALSRSAIPTEVLAVCSDLRGAEAAIARHRPELLFLDIDLGSGESGFDLLRRHPHPDFAVIFITQHNSSHNAIRAIRASALDFLPKPFLPEELDEALLRFSGNRATNVAQTQSLSQQINAPGEALSAIWIAGTEGRVRVEVSNILYCESDDTYTHFHFLAPVGRHAQLLSSRSIKEYESILQETDLMRVHNEYLVNLRFVEAYKPNSNGGTVELRGGKRINVSRTRREAFVKRMRLRK